jgi:hypothetical protein
VVEHHRETVARFLDRFAFAAAGVEVGDDDGDDVVDGDLVESFRREAVLSTRPSATRCSVRVPSVTSMRLRRHASHASVSSGERGGSTASSARLGTRSAASSPVIQRLRAVASRPVLNEPP